MATLSASDNVHIQFNHIATQELKAPISEIAWSPNGHQLATGTEYGSVIILDAKTSEIQYEIPAHKAEVSAVSWSRNRNLLATGSKDHQAFIWEIKNSEPKLVRELLHEGQISSISWNPRYANRIASGCEDSTVRIWNSEDKKPRLFSGHRGWVSGVTWHPYGGWLASCSQDETILLWRDTEEPQSTLLGHKGWVTSIAWHPKGNILASGSVDGAVKLWYSPIENMKKEVHTDYQFMHKGPVLSVVFSSDGNYLASKSQDGTIRIWDMESSEQIGLLESPVGEPPRIGGLAFHPKDLRIAVRTHSDHIIEIHQLEIEANPQNQLRHLETLTSEKTTQTLDTEPETPNTTIKKTTPENVRDLAFHLVYGRYAPPELLTQFDVDTYETALNRLAPSGNDPNRISNLLGRLQSEQPNVTPNPLWASWALAVHQQTLERLLDTFAPQIKTKQIRKKPAKKATKKAARVPVKKAAKKAARAPAKKIIKKAAKKVKKPAKKA